MVRKNPQTNTIPTALRRVAASRHCGVSTTYFEKMVGDGILPAPRFMGEGVKIWLRDELDDALHALPADAEAAQNPCDELLG